MNTRGFFSHHSRSRGLNDIASLQARAKLDPLKAASLSRDPHAHRLTTIKRTASAGRSSLQVRYECDRRAKKTGKLGGVHPRQGVSAAAASKVPRAISKCRFVKNCSARRRIAISRPLRA